jgi:5-methylthioadenosine/S-adenosylhomocysteine deaminase
MRVSAIIGLRELFSSGCCGLLDMGSVEHSGIIVEILRASGARALIGNALMDQGPSYLARPLAWLQRESERVREACGERVGYAYTPRFVLSCSRELWDWLAGEDPEVVRSTHSSEAAGEMEEPRIMKAGGNARLLDDLGFLGKRTILAHCIHLTPGEAGLLADRGTAVAHCPWANLKLGSGIARIPDLLESGVTVVTASDGSSCNNSLDLASDTRLAMGLAAVTGDPGKLSGKEWFDMASRVPSSFFGFDNGGDSAELELTPREEDELHTCEDPWKYILELSWPGRVRRLTCGGTVLYEDGEFPTLPALPVTVRQARETVLAGAESLA